MTAGKTFALLFIAAVLYLSYPALAAQCTQAGKYCVSNVVFECVGGQAVLVEDCKDLCDSGACVEAPLKPSVGAPEVKPQATTLGNDYILYTLTIIIALTVVILLVRLRRRK